jgi:hypothetical protein
VTDAGDPTTLCSPELTYSFACIHLPEGSLLYPFTLCSCKKDHPGSMRELTPLGNPTKDGCKWIWSVDSEVIYSDMLSPGAPRSSTY